MKDLLEEDGKLIGYLTGYSIYNQLGLTTQVSNTIQIGQNYPRAAFQRERYTIAFITQKNIITKDNIALLQIPDAIRYIKKIPDARIEQSCRRFLSILKSFSEKDTKTIVRLALKYPPATRALLGAIIEELQWTTLNEPLYTSLNPLTKYPLTGAKKALSSTEKWNIE